MELNFASRRSINGEKKVVTAFNGVMIPNWIWGAIKSEAKNHDVSEHWVIKQALKQYLGERGYSSEIESDKVTKGRKAI